MKNRDAGSSSSGVTAKEWKEQRMREEALHASSLQVPRRSLLLLWVVVMESI